MLKGSSTSISIFFSFPYLFSLHVDSNPSVISCLRLVLSVIDIHGVPILVLKYSIFNLTFQYQCMCLTSLFERTIKISSQWQTHQKYFWYLNDMYRTMKVLFLIFFCFNFQPKLEAIVFEIDYCRNDLIDTINNLKEWMKPEKVRLCYSFIGGG